MITYRCDGCGRELRKSALRYHAKIEVRAAYDEMNIGLMDLVRDHRAELAKLVEQLENKGVEELEASVYKSFEYDLCPACQRAYLRNPLHFQPNATLDEPPVDIDAFLRSLGYGTEGDDE